MKVINFLATTRPSQPKTCADIQCDHSATVSCTETRSGPRCICKNGFYSAQNNITCLGMSTIVVFIYLLINWLINWFINWYWLID